MLYYCYYFFSPLNSVSTQYSSVFAAEWRTWSVVRRAKSQTGNKVSNNNSVGINFVILRRSDIKGEQDVRNRIKLDDINKQQIIVIHLFKAVRDRFGFLEECEKRSWTTWFADNNTSVYSNALARLRYCFIVVSISKNFHTCTITRLETT